MGNSDTENPVESQNTTDVRTSWVYQLRKPELLEEIHKFGLIPEGTIQQLRQQLVAFLRDGRRTTEQTAPGQLIPVKCDESTVPAAKHVCDIVRKWNNYFDGYGDAVLFLERLEELRVSYGLTGNQLLSALPEMLRKSAILWYRSNKFMWKSWDDFLVDFKQFYLPPDYDLRLEEEISRRRQKTGEKGRTYLVELQTLIRRHGGLSTEQALYRLYINLLPEYRRYIKRTDFSDVRGLVTQIEEYESLHAELQRQKPARVAAMDATTNHPARSNRQYDQDRVCWRCGKEGHFRTECKNTPKIYCFRCGKEGILTRNCSCPPKQGNGFRAAGKGEPSSPN